MIKATIAISLLGLLQVSAFASRGNHKQVMIEACAGKQVGASCIFEGKRGQVEGSCVERRRDADVLICKDPNRKKKRRNRQ